jgi:ABC-2 type transport system permease protein
MMSNAVRMGAVSAENTANATAGDTNSGSSVGIKKAKVKYGPDAGEIKTLTRNMSKTSRELNTVVAVIAREITLFFKSPGTIIMSVAMPLVMMGMIGGNLMQNMAGGLGFSFGTFMLVGMMVNMMFMVTSMGMTSLVDDHETDFNQEMLVSPVSRYSLVIGKIFGAMFGAIISLVGTLLVGAIMGITLPVGQLLLILALSPLMCLSGGALAMLAIGLIKSAKTANFAVMVIVMPQMFLSGAIIPISNSSGVLMILSRMMPMTYCIDLVRAVVYSGTPEYDSVVMFNPLINFAAIVGLTVVCLFIGTYFYARTEKNR